MVFNTCQLTKPSSQKEKRKKKKKKIKPWLEKTKNLNHFKSTISTMVDE